MTWRELVQKTEVEFMFTSNKQCNASLISCYPKIKNNIKIKLIRETSIYIKL